MASGLDVVVVGAGPNGLTAALVLARAGLAVAVFEAGATVGGGCRTAPVTLPGFQHDICAAIHPMAAASPIFNRLRLTDQGVDWLSAQHALAHPFVDGRVALLSRQPGQTAATLVSDGRRWSRLLSPFIERHEDLFDDVLRPIRLPRHPLLMARFGALALQSSERLQREFTSEAARAMFAGIAAHGVVPLTSAGSAAFGLVLAVAGHAVDWPCARGGSGTIVAALSKLATAAGCAVTTGATVRTVRDLPPARLLLFDVTPRQLLQIAGDRLSSRYRRQLARFRYGPGIFKIDYALSARIPWAADECQHAATVHLGDRADAIAGALEDCHAGRIPEHPFVLVAQQSHLDPSRAPAGKHTGWAYCHVPHGADVDMTERIERQIERFAPGFRDVVLARRTTSPADLEEYDANRVGGDIGGGANVLRQFLLRPTPRWDPYSTSDPDIFLCSSSTPPGGGVHGMCGYWAARSALRRLDHRVPDDLRL